MSKIKYKQIEVTAEEFRKYNFILPQIAIDEIMACENCDEEAARKTLARDLEHSSKTFLCFVDDVPIFVGGVDTNIIYDTPEGDAYCVWGFSSVEAQKFPLSMVKIGRKVVEELVREFGLLYNTVDRRYKKSQEWLQLLGFYKNGDEFNFSGHPFDAMFAGRKRNRRNK